MLRLQFNVFKHISQRIDNIPMPAIQPARLKIRVSQLIERVNTPIEFISMFEDLLEFYSDRTQKPHRGSPRVSLIPTYNVPSQVTKLIEGMLQSDLETHPERAIALADSLWCEKWLEAKILALVILGWISPEPPERIIDRLKIWGQECGEDQVLNESISRGLVSLMKETTYEFFDLLEFWLNSQDPATQKIGLRIIPPLVDNPEFNNLPRIFRSITPFIQQTDKVPDIVVIKLIRALAHRSPQETAFFLQRNLASTENENIYCLIRQSLSAFSSPVREDMQNFLHGR
jgi:hypothetical protein